MKTATFITCYLGIFALIGSVIAVIFSFDPLITKVLLFAFMALIVITLVLDVISARRGAK